MKVNVKAIDSSTEEKIIQAARKIFTQQGYAATKVRDIAAEADINLSLVNYYFRSKEKLFYLIMVETLTKFYKSMGEVFNHEATSLEEKVQLMVEKYIDLIIAEPEVPLFILSEIRHHGAEILEKLPVADGILQSVFIRQYKEAVNKGEIINVNPLHFLMNLTGLVVFPFVNGPMLKKVGKLQDGQFDELMQERKTLIPIWIKAMLKADGFSV